MLALYGQRYGSTLARSMATFVDLDTHRSGSRHQSQSTRGADTRLKDYVKDLTRRPKLIVLDVGKSVTTIDHFNLHRLTCVYPLYHVY